MRLSLHPFVTRAALLAGALLLATPTAVRAQIPSDRPAGPHPESEQGGQRCQIGGQGQGRQEPIGGQGAEGAPSARRPWQEPGPEPEGQPVLG